MNNAQENIYGMRTGERDQEEQEEEDPLDMKSQAEVANKGGKGRDARAAITETQSDIAADAKQQYMDIEDE